MAGITAEFVEMVTEMAKDVAVIKETIKPLPDMYKDVYIGNGNPPMRKTCRDYEDEKKTRETAKTEAIKEKKDDHKWLNRLIIGGIIGILIAQSGAFVFAYIKLLPFFELLR